MILRMTKLCKRCGEPKAITEFSFIMRGRYRNSYCKKCVRSYQRERSKTDIARARSSAKNKRYYAAHKDRIAEQKHAWVEKLWNGLFAIYGQACVCCGDTERAFLTVDHVNDDGHKDQKSGIRKFHRWLLKQPKLPEYRILCYNCNSGRYRNGGICPHEQENSPALRVIGGGK
jgi:hypothetical protein